MRKFKHTKTNREFTTELIGYNQVEGIKWGGWEIPMWVVEDSSDWEEIKKTKIPLFTTEDGVDIFEGDAIFGINAYGEVFSHCSGLPNKIMNWGKNPIFSTQVLAERYIELNSPKYTALDMLKVANHYAYIKDVTEDKILKYLAKNGI